jgi:hypothetical protein
MAFDVSRVWKGDVAKHVEVYNLFTGGDESIAFREHQEYLVIGFPANSKQKETMGLAVSSAATFTGACSAEPFSPATRRILNGAAGHQPR